MYFAPRISQVFQQTGKRLATSNKSQALISRRKPNNFGCSRRMATHTKTIEQWENEFDSRGSPATHDFRSDTVTMPTAPMLSSILANATTYGDDVFSEDQAINDLESYVAELAGMKGAVFVSSGTMGNQIALRCLLKQPPHSVVCDRRSHIFEHECGMTSIFSQAQLIPIMPDVDKHAYLTLEDIIPNVVPDDGDTHGAPTRVIALENTFWGKVVPLEEVQRVSQYARERGIKVHLDGARLWNACYGGLSDPSSPDEASRIALSRLKDYCKLVDTVSLCFSKSLGAPSGSIFLSNSPDILQRARHFRKALGGGMRQIGVLGAPARVAVDNVFMSGVHMPRANAMAKDLEETWKSLGGSIQPGLSQETNMLWIDLKEARAKDGEFSSIAKEEGVKVFDGRIVTHYQISSDAIKALKRAFKRTIEIGRTRSADPEPDRSTGAFSYNLGQVPGE